MKTTKPVALLILDGWGIAPSDARNAITCAKTPVMDGLLQEYPHARLVCSGEAVGLPAGQMGNSEVGHLNIGAGRVVYQELTRISKAIRDGDFFANPVFAAALDNLQARGGDLHLMGLLSDGGVHSHIDHLLGLLELAKRKGVARVYVHAFLDGRDVPPANACHYIEQLQDAMRQSGVGCLATVSGRYYAMDRDKRWERTQMAYAALVYREGERADDAIGAVRQSYARQEHDEFVRPTVIANCPGNPAVKDGDAVIFYNFRPDRARQLTRAFVDPDFSGFERRTGKITTDFVCLTQYDETIKAKVAFAPQYLANTLGEVVSNADMQQLRIAETEKYAHVTFFFNGGEEKPFKGETRVLIPSPKVATYDLQPQMSAGQVTEAVLTEIRKQQYDLIVLNFANGDMVGHTGMMDAAVQAVGVVDRCVGQIVNEMRVQGGSVLITADHGNAEQMVDPHDGGPWTAHTTNPVPLVLVDDDHRDVQLSDGALADLAPTVIKLLGLAQPNEMTGKSLI